MLVDAELKVSYKKSKRDKKETDGPSAAERISFPLRLYNKLEQNKQLTNKKGVFVNMRRYYESIGQDPFKVLPLTFHTTQGVNDPEYRRFAHCFQQVEQKFKQSDAE